MDFGMARLMGLTACRNILREDPNGCILFLSGLGERVELTPEASGAFAVLQKPIEHAQLDQALRNASQHRTGGKGSTAVSADS
jgi:CheY-like chemotaxis protein